MYHGHKKDEWLTPSHRLTPSHIIDAVFSPFCSVYRGADL